MGWSQNFIVGVGALIGVVMFSINFLYSLWFMYSFYVDERKNYDRIKLFGIKKFEWNFSADRLDYGNAGFLCILVGAFFSANIAGVSVLVIALINYVPLLTLIVVGSIFTIVSIAKIHRTVNNINYKFKDHEKDPKAHQTLTEEQ
jgi:hypothetical protein